MSLSSLRERLGYVPQQAVLFSGTIASNIRAGRRDADDSELRAAAEVAQALKFILEKDGQFEAPSAKEAQMYQAVKSSGWLLLELWSGSRTFTCLMIRFRRWTTRLMLTSGPLYAKSRDKTVIVVAQRVSSILQADQILVLDSGRIVGKGTHGELLQSCPVYREIVASQLGGEETA